MGTGRGRVVWHCSMSVDGFIAGPGGDMQWVFKHADQSTDTGDEARGIGAVLMGRTSHDVDIRVRPSPEKNFAYGGMYDGPVMVLAHKTDPREKDPRVQFVSGDVREHVEKALAAAKGRNVLVIGADIARQCLDAGLVDEIILEILPVLVGDGTRLYSVAGARIRELEPVEVTRSGAVTRMRFRLK